MIYYLTRSHLCELLEALWFARCSLTPSPSYPSPCDVPTLSVYLHTSQGGDTFYNLVVTIRINFYIEYCFNFVHWRSLLYTYLQIDNGRQFQIIYVVLSNYVKIHLFLTLWRRCWRALCANYWFSVAVWEVSIQAKCCLIVMLSW